MSDYKFAVVRANGDKHYVVGRRAVSGNEGALVILDEMGDAIHVFAAPEWRRVERVGEMPR